MGTRNTPPPSPSIEPRTAVIDAATPSPIDCETSKPRPCPIHQYNGDDLSRFGESRCLVDCVDVETLVIAMLWLFAVRRGNMVGAWVGLGPSGADGVVSHGRTFKSEINA